MRTNKKPEKAPQASLPESAFSVLLRSASRGAICRLQRPLGEQALHMSHLFLRGLAGGHVIGLLPGNLVKLLLGLLAGVPDLLQGLLQLLVLGLGNHARVAGQLTVDACQCICYHCLFLHVATSHSGIRSTSG